MDYKGHRQRTKERFLGSYSKNLEMLDEDLLEMILFYSVPRKDVKLLSKSLCKKFGSIANAINCSYEELISCEGVSHNTAVLLLLIKQTIKQVLAPQKGETLFIHNWQQLLDYCYFSLAHEKNEIIKIVYLNIKKQIIKEETAFEGTFSSAMLNPRELIQRCLELGASAIILIHNHPSGDPTPSAADIETTKNIKDILGKIDILLHDHIIIGKKNIISFKKEGILL